MTDNKQQRSIWLTGVIISGMLIAGYSSSVSLASPASLPLGDGRVTDVPARHHVFSCAGERFESVAHRSGDWIAGGRYEPGKKPTVQGEIHWPSDIEISIDPERNTREITTNNFPSHPTGEYPISRQDDVVRYQRNGSPVRLQDFSITLPLLPERSPNAHCLPAGPVGVMLTGSLLFDPLDPLIRDTGAHDMTDACQGHPDERGIYHYHQVSDCDPSSTSPHALTGYAADGFGLFNATTDNNDVLTNEDLDECHGHEHDIPWDDDVIPLYHYHETPEFPYALGCLRGPPQMNLDLPAVKRSSMKRTDRGFQPRVSPDGRAMPR
ncbi:MAG: YHYH protein [Pseudomonadota bacterium]